MLDLIIYDEELNFYETELSMERCLYETNLELDLLYCESYNDKSNNEKFKSIINKIIEMFKKFIQKCREYLKSVINKIIGRVNELYQEYKLKTILKNFDKSIANAEKQGIKKFKFIDITELQKCLEDESDEYEKEIKKFSRSYIKHANPKDAEKMIENIRDIDEKYSEKIHNIINNLKEYSINEAKKVANILEDCSDKSNSKGFINIIKRYQNVCTETEQLVESTLKSLENYSEDTGYIQNAKTLKEMIYNSCIRLQSHTAEIITVILSYGIPIICFIDETINTKTIETDSDDGTKINKDIDNSSLRHQKTRNIVSNISENLGYLTTAELKSVRKVSRKNDINSWKNKKDDSPLSFDNRVITKSELTDATKKSPVELGLVLTDSMIQKKMIKKVPKLIEKGGNKIVEYIENKPTK